MSPVALCRQIAKEQILLHAQYDFAGCTGNFTGHECLTTQWRLVIEQYPVAGVHLVSFAIVHRNPVSIHFRNRIRRARIKRRCFLLWNFLHQTVQFRGRRLIDTGFIAQTQQTYGFQNTQGAYTVGIGCVLGRIETHFYVTHGCQVINFIGLHLLNDTGDVHRVGKVAIVQYQIAVLHMRILIQVIDAVGIEQRRATLHPMYNISHFQQVFCQIGAILPGNPGN